MREGLGEPPDPTATPRLETRFDDPTCLEGIID
jgi:hypothetical protein